MTILQVDDRSRVRTLTLNRPDALNAFNEALYDELTEALRAAATDDSVAVVLLTGTGRAFSAGTDLAEMAERVSNPDFVPGKHGFTGLVDTLEEFDKPLVLAINGLGLGVGVTIIGFADLVFMSTGARLKCPFASLGVAPEAASSYLLPHLIGRQNAAWVLMSSEWITAPEALEMGLVWRTCEPQATVDIAHDHATRLATLPISSLRAIKRTMVEPFREGIAEARRRENQCFVDLMGGPANQEALTAFAEGRAADFTSLPAGW
ncbi:MAG: crotonase [Aeromicrobium sp.]|nr:crotonase [Aeromicrobium sp.]